MSASQPADEARGSDILEVTTAAHVGVSVSSSESGAVRRAGRRVAANMSILHNREGDLSGRDLLGETGRTRPGGLGVVDGRVDADGHGSISADIVLVGTVLAALSSNALQLLLGRRVGIADLHLEALVTNGLAMETADDLLANLTRLEAIMARQSRAHNPRYESM